MSRSKSPAARARRHEKAVAALAVYRACMADLRASGACCAVCRHRGEHRTWSCRLEAAVTEMLCTLHGEGGGITSPTTPENLCTDFDKDPTP